MIQQTRSSEQLDIESPLPELPRLRELSRLDAPPASVSRAVFARLQHTLHADTQVGPHSTRPRIWVLALGMTVAVPTAFAATPAGSALVERTMQWATRVLQIEDSAEAPRETFKTSVARVSREAKVEATNGSAAQVTNDNPQHIAQPGSVTPVAVFEDAPTPVPSGSSLAPSQKPALALSPSLVQAPSPGVAAVAVAPVAVTSVVVVPAFKPRAEAAHSAVAHGAASAPGATEPSAPVGTLNAERLLLEDARARLRAGDAPGALALTSRHAALFPDGILSAERHAIINQVRQLEGRDP